MEDSKACTKCGQIKPLSDFHKLKDKRKSQCAQCLKDYWQQNKERLTGYSRASYQRNKAKKLDYQKKYYEQNPEVVQATKRKYLEQNKSQRAKTLSNYRSKNAERIRENKRQFYKQNAEKWLSYAATRRQRQKGNWQVTTNDIRKLQNMACIYCGSRSQIEIDHVVPLSRGGRHALGNLAPACRSCNRSKGSKFVVEWRYRISEL